MNEPTIRDYFEGIIGADRLKSESRSNKKDLYHREVQAIHKGRFNVTTKHLSKVCDDVLSNKINIETLDQLAFILIGSDYFDWNPDDPDGRIVSEVLFEWNNPEINYPLNLANVHEWNNYLNGRPRIMNKR